MLTLTLCLIEPRGSMPHSQGPSNNPYPEPNQPKSSYWRLLIIHSNIVLSSTPRPSRNYFSYMFACQNFEIIPIFLLSGYMICLSSSSRFNHSGYIGLWNSLLCSLLHITSSSLLATNIRLRILFSNTLACKPSIICKKPCYTTI